MSRTTPGISPAGTPDDPKRAGPNGSAAGPNGPGMPAQRPLTTTPKAPEVGASAPPTPGGMPANKLPPGASTGGMGSNKVLEPSASDDYDLATPTGPAPAPSKPSAAPPAPAGPAARPVPGGSGVNGPGGAHAPPAGTPVTTMPPISELQKRPIGRILTKMGRVTREQVMEALDFQKRKGGALGRILVDLGYVKEVDLNIALAAQLGYELISV